MSIKDVFHGYAEKVIKIEFSFTITEFVTKKKNYQIILLLLNNLYFMTHNYV